MSLANNNKKIKFIDLFAGIGGFHLAIHEVLHAECVCVSEWDKFARQTYKFNFDKISPKIFIEKPNTYSHIQSMMSNDFLGDITKIKPEEIPNHDVLCAGFPCQPFSLAGLKKGFSDTRGTLFFNVAQIIKIKKPKVVWLENVKNLKNHDRGNTFQVIVNTLKELGYTIYSQVLNAKDYGLPQNRERIYIIGFRNDIPIKKFCFPSKMLKKTRLGDILDKNVDDKYTISDKLWNGHQRRKKEHQSKGNGFGYCLFNEESQYTSTISARYYKDGSEILIEQKAKNPRKLSPREALRLQGFPEWYEFPVSDNQAYKQCGNSVAVPVLKCIAQQIKKTGVFDN